MFRHKANYPLPVIMSVRHVLFLSANETAETSTAEVRTEKTTAEVGTEKTTAEVRIESTTAEVRIETTTAEVRIESTTAGIETTESKCTKVTGDILACRLLDTCYLNSCRTCYFVKHFHVLFIPTL